MSETVTCVCGSDKAMNWDQLFSHPEDKWRIKCDDCGLCGPWGESLDEAEDAWSKMQRALKHFPAVVEELEKQQRKCQSMGLDISHCDTCKRRFDTKDCTLPKVLKAIEEEQA